MVTFWRYWIFAAITGVGAFVGMLVPPLVADENVGIGTTRPDSSAVLDVSIEALSRPRGILIPRMTEQERDAIIFPARGLLIFNTTRNRIEMNIGDRTTPVWARFVTYGESSGGDWALTGNAGIDPSRNFLGTVDAAPLIFKTDARERMRITPIGAVGIGTVTPLGLFAVGPNSEFYVDSSGTIYGVQLWLQGSNARLYIDGSSGIAGDVLVSSGPNAPQRWTKQLDSLGITSLRSSTVSSRSVVTDTLRAQYIVGGIPFDSVKSGVNQNQTLTVGNGSVLSATGTGIVQANRVNLTGTSAPLETNGNAGSSGQLLKSRGAGQTPEWTWRLDSVDVGRLTVDHVWTDTLTADSVRARVGRFDSVMVGSLRAAIPFDSVKSGVNQNQTLTVGNGSTVEASGTGIVRANRVNLTGTNAPLETNGNAGTSGQLLKSKGAGQTPEWTWRLDSVDVGRLTVDHIWSDTLTADSVRGRVGRFDSLIVDFLRGDTAYISSLRIDTLYSTGVLRAAVPFDSVKSGVNQNQTLTVGNGSVLEASGSGIVRANRVNLTGTNAPLETNGNAGTSGQLLKSRGAGQTPEWTWRLDSLDVGRLTVEHVWSDTLTADSVRARVGRFDSVVVGSLRAAIPFDSVKSGVNQNQTLTVGNGSVLSATGTGIVQANRVNLTGTNAPLETNGNAGTSGQLLKSRGAGQTPEWTWRLDSVDVGRLTVDHIWSDTLTADSVRGRVGRFDSLIVDFLRGDTAYISSLRIDTLYSTGVLRAAVPFDSVKSGVNQNQTLTVGNGSVLEASGSGIVRANRVNLTGTNAPLETNGNAGTSGQLLKSRGAGQTPEWTWRLDSVDVGRLTVEHVWSDTLTADSVRARVGRFDSVVVDFVRGDTAYISSLRIDSLYSSGGMLRAAIPFDSVKSGVNQNQTLTVGNGSVLSATGTGIVQANRVNLTGTNAPLETNGNAGTSGQLLKSRGAGQTPEWTWRLDSVDVGRLTVDHIWSDTLTADSVRARVGRFDSVVVGSLRAAVPFDSVKSGVNQNQTLTVGNGSVLEASGSGIVRANRVNLTGTNAPLETNGNAGTSGQLLKSKGAGQTPEWTWRLDSVDVGRLTVDHIWSDTLTADSVHARVGRFDSVVVGSLRAAIPFDSVKSGVNQNQTLTVGNGSTVEASGTGIVRANRVNLTGTNAPLETNGSAGTSGQLLKSKGAGQTPEWTWRLDSVDVGRLTVDHIWSDTLTADSVRARVGRFDSVVVGSLRAAIPFDSVKSGVNQNQTLTVGNGSTVEASGTGIVRANRVNLTGTNAPLEANGNAGTNGQLLKSRGAGQTPEWTWSLDSLDIGRLTTNHVWADTVTADSVRGRVGRFDSLIVDFLRGDTAYISSLRIDTLYSTGVLRAAVPFDSVKSGVNQNQTLTVGNGSVLSATGTGIVQANRVNLTGTSAPLETNGNAGTSGQLLKSKGAGQTPEWTWSLDSLDISRLTTNHVWADTVTADSVRGRVGRFDSLIVDFLRGDTAYVSSLRVDSIFSTGVLRAAVPFDSVKSGINQNQTLTVGDGSVLSATGTGIVQANRVNLTGTNAPLETNGNAGSSGQLLKSRGAGQTPEWTWSLDSLDIGRLTTNHVWADTVTADSVRGRVGRFDSLVVDFLRGDTAYISSMRTDTAYISSLRVDSIFSTGVLRAAVPFDSVKSGINQNQTLTVGNGSVLSATGTGIVQANRVNLTGTNAPLEANGNAGSSGQLLKSRGAGQTPEWTWSVDSLDIRRLTTKHVWADTVTADSVRGRVGRFDSLIVDFLRGDTAYISSLRIDTLYSSGGVLRAAVPFDSVKSGINQNQTLTVGNGSVLSATGTGIVQANRVNLTGTNAPLETNGNAGSSGQLLKSRGAGQTPEWTWSLDSLDVSRLTTNHVWADTVTADSVRGRVGRFDSLIVDFLRGDTAYISSMRTDTAYISSLRVDSIFSTGVLRAAVPFDSVKSGINQNQTLTVGNGSVLSATGTGIVQANRVNLTGTNAPLETNGNAGSSGQLLKSRGAGQTPEWTWSLDSLDIGRLTTNHVWADTVTADSVRGRVGRFDSLIVDFLRGDTAYVSSLRVDSIFSTGVLRAAVPFDSVKSGINQNQTLTVGNGSVLSATGTGIVQANRVNLTGTSAPLETNGNAGTSGQLLKSKGAGQTPEWTWSLDSLDIGRLTTNHVWADTVTADSVRGRVGRFDSVVVGSLRAAIPFDSVKSGINQNQTLTVGNGSVLSATGTGIVRANRVNLTGTSAPLETNGNAGTSGQLLKSKGAGATPEWTWSVDSLDIRRLTTKHVWADTVTADSVRGRIGRFDSLVVATPFAWQLKGNSGTNPATNFLGTTDAQPLVVRTNGTERLRIESGGNVGIGTSSPTSRLHVNAPSDPLRLEGVQTEASPSQVLTVTPTGVVKKASVASIVGGGILKGIFTPTTTASQFTINPGQDIQPGAVVVVTVYGTSSTGVVGAMVTNINAAADTFTVATTMAIDNTYAIHYIIINP